MAEIACKSDTGAMSFVLPGNYITFLANLPIKPDTVP